MQDERKETQWFSNRLHSKTGDKKKREMHPPTFKKSLTFNASRWSDLECSALVEFVIANKRGETWPFGKETQFWEATAETI